MSRLRPRLALDRRTADAVRRGHPWVYADQLPKGLAWRAGDEVDLQDPRGEWLARALLDPGAPIPLRVFTRDAGEGPVATVLAPRVASALRERERVLDVSRTTGWRWLHGEGDDLPGLVVDWYAGVAVVRTYWAAWEGLLGTLVEALRAASPELRAVVRAPSPAVAGRGGPTGGDPTGPAGPVPLWGKAEKSVVIAEGTRRYPVRPGRGQKTGFFLDQRPARDRVEALRGPLDRGLNLFSFTGGFSVALARAGTRQVVSVDIAAGAVEGAEAAFRASDLDPAAHRFVTADAFAFLEEEAAHRAVYDVLVSDPPALARNREQVPAALLAYEKLHRGLARVAARKALLVTASCTARVTEDDFADAARRGLARAGRRLRVVERLGAGPDHPVPLGFPEGRYLKVLVGFLD